MGELTAQEHFRAGRLDEAVISAMAAVKAAPGYGVARMTLAQLLCFQGEFERADTHLDLAASKDPKLSMMATLCRQLMRAEQARRELFTAGRPPEFLAPPGKTVELMLRATIETRQKNASGALALLEEAEIARPRVPGTSGCVAFDDFFDLDDQFSGVLEALTSTGKYYWIPTDTISCVSFEKPMTRFHFLWLPTKVKVRGGSDGVVYVPAIYPLEAEGEQKTAARLGRITEWFGGDNSPVRGVGQRLFQIGGAQKTMLEIGSIEFSGQATTAGEPAHA